MIVPGCWQASFCLRRPRQPQPAVEAEVVEAAPVVERAGDPALELARALLLRALPLRAQLPVAVAAVADAEVAAAVAHLEAPVQQPDKLQAAAPQEQVEAVAVVAVEAAALRQQQLQPLRLPRLP